MNSERQRQLAAYHAKLDPLRSKEEVQTRLAHYRQKVEECERMLAALDRRLDTAQLALKLGPVGATPETVP